MDAYKRLAYRQAIFEALIEYTLETYVGNEVYPPTHTIDCARLAKEDSEVPVGDIMEFVADLKGASDAIEVELRKYSFTRRPDESAGLEAYRNILQPTAAKPEATKGDEGSGEGKQRKKRRRRR